MKSVGSWIKCSHGIYPQTHKIFIQQSINSCPNCRMMCHSHSNYEEFCKAETSLYRFSSRFFLFSHRINILWLGLLSKRFGEWWAKKGCFYGHYFDFLLFYEHILLVSVDFLLTVLPAIGHKVMDKSRGETLKSSS